MTTGTSPSFSVLIRTVTGMDSYGFAIINPVTGRVDSNPPASFPAPYLGCLALRRYSSIRLPCLHSLAYSAVASKISIRFCSNTQVRIEERRLSN